MFLTAGSSFGSPDPFRHTDNAPTDSIHLAWVRLFGSDLLHSLDIAVGIVADRVGDTYVLGSSCASVTSFDFITIKYDPSGQELWTRRYNGTANGSDFASAIAVDISGNIFVTGSSWGHGNRYDGVAVKYNASGEEEWVTRLEGSADSSLIPRALRVDNAGNVYLAGYLGMPDRPAGFVTVKLDGLGNVLWTARHSTSGTGGAGSFDLAVDDSGNVLVTGTDTGPGGNDDWMTVKYNPAGQETWAAQYNGPGNDRDIPTAIGVDRLGSVFVVGRTTTPDGSDDCATIKYNAAGVEQWVRSYDGPAHGIDAGVGIVLDDTGNVYVTGSSDGDTAPDFVTIKYNSTGDSQWVARYNGPANGEDYPYAIGLDSQTNVFVAGMSTGSGSNGDFAVVRYSPAGLQQWVATTDIADGSSDGATAMALDSLGRVHVAGSTRSTETNPDMAAALYDTSGAEVWTAKYDGPGTSMDIPTALAVDGSGNVAVTGASADSAGQYHYVTVKYDPSGVIAWTGRFFMGNATDNAADAAGNIYVTGVALDSTGSTDYLTIKYDPSGSRQWIARYNRLANSMERARALTVDSSGCVYVTGGSYSTSTNYDIYTVKYDSTGTQQWVSSYTGFGSRSDTPRAIVVDAQGNSYVTGTTWTDEPVSQSNYVTLKYSPSGQIMWASMYNGPGNGADAPRDIAVDRNGNVYVTGQSSGAALDLDYATVKYNAFGAEVWAARYGHTPGSSDKATSMAVDAGGNVYVTGLSDGAFTTVKYNPAGVQQWDARYGPAWGFEAFIAMDSTGYVYVAGTAIGLDDKHEFATIKYDASGVEQWAERFHQPGSNEDSPVAIAIDRMRNVYVAGTTRMGSGTMFATVKYEQGATSVQESAAYATTYRLEQNFPNPWNPATTIVYSLPAAGRVVLRVFDILGREIRTLVDEEQGAGTHVVRFDATNLSSGVYFYRLQAGGYAAVKRMMVVK